MGIVLLNAESDTGNKLIRILLAAIITDNKANIGITPKALHEVAGLIKQNKVFRLLAERGDSGDLELGIEWHD